MVAVRNSESAPRLDLSAACNLLLLLTPAFSSTPSSLPILPSWLRTQPLGYDQELALRQALADSPQDARREVLSLILSNAPPSAPAR